MIVFYVATKSEATQAAKHIDGAYRKVDGGWAVMDWE